MDPLAVALLIDDNAVDADILRRQLGRMPGASVELRHALDVDSGLAGLADPEIGAVFLDFCLDGEDGLQALARIRAAGDDRGVIVVTGQGDEYVAARCIQAGADDYIVKGDIDPESLARALRNAQAQQRRRRAERDLAEAVRQLGEANRKLELLARFDELTGLANRRFFRERLAQELKRAERYGNRVSLLFCDVDRFKEINDRHGHHVGDRVLESLGRILSEYVRESDVAARLGGDELCVLLTQTPLSGAQVFAERLRGAVAARGFATPAGTALTITLSVGVAESAGAGDPDELVQRADAALYDAKRSGRNRVAIAAPGARVATR